MQDPQPAINQRWTDRAGALGALHLEAFREVGIETAIEGIRRYAAAHYSQTMPTLNQYIGTLDRLATPEGNRTRRHLQAIQLHPSFYRGALLGLDTLVITELYILLLAQSDTALPAPLFHFGHLALVFALAMMPLALIGGYNRSGSRSSSVRFACEHMVASIISVSMGFVVCGSMVLSGTLSTETLYPILLTLAVFPIASLIYRLLLNRQLDAALQESTLFVVGHRDSARAFYKDLKERQWPQRLMFFSPSERDENSRLEPDDPCSPLLCRDLLAAVRESGDSVHAVVVADPLDRLDASLKGELVALNRDRLPVLELDTFHSRYWQTVPVHAVDLSWALREGFELNRNPFFKVGKRMLDVVVSSTLLVLLAPLMGLVAALIKLDSPGPAVFRQTRVGKGGRPFTLLKYRSMTCGSEKGDLYTRREDARITRIGKFIRKTRIDELPQLINVLRGDMSLVGPRAEWIRCTDIYEKKIPNYHLRHLVKPGITGWAQVNYPYGENEHDAVEKLKYDLYYIRHYSLMLDFSTCLKTLYTIIAGKGQ